MAASTAALRAGKTNWRAVSAFWARCRTFEATAAAEVDQAVFGPLLAHPTPEDQTENPDPADETPDTDVENPGTEAPDSDEGVGEIPDGEDGVGEAPGQDQRCESWAEFSRRLEREAVRAESADAAQARAKRRAAHARRDVQARIGDQGSGEVILTGSTTCVAGAVERIEAIARAAKAAGDPRSLGQIRSDTAFALLVHGILPLPGTCGGACPTHTDATGTTGAAVHGSTTGTGRPAGSAARSVFTAEPLIETPEDIHRIITGQPVTHVEVIVPASFLTDPDSITPDDTDTTIPGDESDPPAHAGNESDPPADAGNESDPPADAGNESDPPADAGGGADPPSPDPAPCQQRPRRRRSGGVAEIVGYGFLIGEHARELVATPGSTLYRLLTDPADGRLLERTIAAYRPDAAMITQVRAADVFCRAPGCLVPARRCDIDHEQEHDQGGPTAEPHLGNKHRPHHQVKTAKFWATTMTATRQVTWRTLFGRMYTTRPHDYTQYDKTSASPGPDSTLDPSRPDGSMLEGSRPEAWVDPTSLTDPDTRNQLIYAALSTRTGMDRWLEAIDDDEDAWRYGYERPLTLFHHTDGRRRPGPPPGQPGPNELINPTPPPTPDQDPPPF